MGTIAITSILHSQIENERRRPPQSAKIVIDDVGSDNGFFRNHNPG